MAKHACIACDHVNELAAPDCRLCGHVFAKQPPQRKLREGCYSGGKVNYQDASYCVCRECDHKFTVGEELYFNTGMCRCHDCAHEPAEEQMKPSHLISPEAMKMDYTPSGRAMAIMEQQQRRIPNHKPYTKEQFDYLTNYDPTRTERLAKKLMKVRAGELCRHRIPEEVVRHKLRLQGMPAYHAWIADRKAQNDGHGAWHEARAEHLATIEAQLRKELSWKPKPWPFCPVHEKAVVLDWVEEGSELVGYWVCQECRGG